MEVRLLRLLAKYRDADQLTAVRMLEGGLEWMSYPRRPHVIIVTQLAFSRWRPAVYQLPYLGYRLVEREPYLHATRYVRPLPLWLCHRAGVAALNSYRKSIVWLYDRGLIGLACDVGAIWRFRDIRPWPFSKRHRHA